MYDEDINWIIGEKGNEPYYDTVSIDTPMDTAGIHLSLENLDNRTYKVLLAAMEADGYSDVDEYLESDSEVLTRLSEYRYMLLEHVFDCEQLAKYYYTFELPEYVDWEGLGDRIHRELNGCFTSQGWFSWDA